MFLKIGSRWVIYEEIMNLVYFIAGAFSMLMCLTLIGGEKPVVKLPKKTWTKLSKIEFKVSFDHTFKNKMTAQEVLYSINKALEMRIDSDTANFKNSSVEAGEYSVDAITTVRFTHRS